MGDDIGGFRGSTAAGAAHALARATGAFNPIYRDHSEKGTHDQEPWVHGAAQDEADPPLHRGALPPVAVRLHGGRGAVAHGRAHDAPALSRIPRMAPGMASHSISANSGSFLLGSDLLVAQSPFPDEMDDYTIALPPTGWYDYWTGSRVSGSSGRKAIDYELVSQSEVHIRRTLDTLPVFVRAEPLPQQPLIQSTDEKPQGPLTLRVFPRWRRKVTAEAASTLMTESATTSKRENSCALNSPAS